MVKQSAKVIFEYQAQESDELSLKVGDIIHDIEPADTGWCKGSVHGKTGMFPDNFVKFIEEKEKPPPIPAVSKKPSNKVKSKKMVKVLFPYEQTNDDELDLIVGETFAFVKEVEEGWAEGEKNGKTGVFPTNFVEIITEEEESSPVKESSPPKEEAEPPHEENKQSKKVKGIGLGNIFGNEPIKLRQRSIGETTENKSAEKKAKINNSASTPKQSKANKIDKEALKKEYCKVMFEYTAENEDELTLVKGEVITLVSKTSCDDGWWEGEKKMPDGTMNKGVFPDNFVVLLTTDQVKEMLLEKENLSNKSSNDSLPETTKNLKSPKPSKEKAPLLPAASLKLSHEASNEHVSFDDIVTNNSDSKLTHVKRVAGPKNRRRPDADERRQKAKQAVNDSHPAPVATESSEDEVVEAKQSPAPAGKGAKHGVAVMPPSDSGDGPPAWLKNLQSRKSQKKPAPAPEKTSPVQPVKSVKSPADSKKPDWMLNLKKKRESGNFDAPPAKQAPLIPPQKPQEKEAKKPPATKSNGTAHKEETPKPKEAIKPRDVSKPKEAVKPRDVSKPKEAVKPKEVSKPKEVPRAKEVPPRPKSPEEPEEKPLAPWQMQLKARKESGVPAAPSTSVENNANAAPHVPAWKQSVKKTVDEPHKPTSSVRSKPPPPRGKPALPGAKPIIATAVVDELKDEIKGLKSEIKSLTLQLEEEKQLRIKLQADVDILKLKLL